MSSLTPCSRVAHILLPLVLSKSSYTALPLDFISLLLSFSVSPGSVLAALSELGSAVVLDLARVKNLLVSRHEPSHLD